jgi:elongin-A
LNHDILTSKVDWRFQHQIEINSPQIIGRDGEIWLNFIKRDIPNWEDKPHQPSNPKNWWKVYRKLKQEAQNDLDQDTEKLKAAFANIKDEKEQNLAQLKTRMELPQQRASFRRRMVHSYISGKTGSKGANKLSLMEKIRKEARETKNLRMAIPTKDLKKQASTVAKAPKDFLEEARKPQERIVQTSPPRHAIRGAAPPMAVSRPSAPSTHRSFLEQEARLLALTSGKGLPRQESEHISSLDGSSTPQPLSTGHNGTPAREPVMPSHQVVQPSAPRPGSSAHSLEPGPNIETGIGDATRTARLNSPGIKSPQPLKTKRKAPPSVFMETKRQKVAPSSSTDDMF